MSKCRNLEDGQKCRGFEDEQTNKLVSLQKKKGNLFFEKISKCQIFPDIVVFRAKSRKFSKCQIFPDIVVFRAKVEKMTISFLPKKIWA